MRGTRRLITVTGSDRAGLIAAISKVLASVGSDIEDVSMTRLSGNFAMMLLARGGEEAALQDGLKSVADEQKLRIHIDEAVEPGAEPGANCYVSAIGPNRVGIVAAISAVLAQNEVNITEMTTRLIEKTKVPVYMVRIEGVAPPETALLEEELGQAAKDLNVEVRFEPIEQVNL